MSKHVKLITRLSLLALAGGLLTVTGVRAQTAAGSPPPTYDFDLATPGTQPPTSPVVANHDYRSLRTYQMTIPVLVPLSQFQAILPPGFNAIPSAEGANTATLSLGFFVDQRFERTGVNESYGPVSALLVSATVTNTNVNPARSELVFPAFEASSDVDALNASFGPGTARLADVKVSVEQMKGKMRFTFNIADRELGLKLRASAEAPTTINNRSTSDPVGLVFRALNGRTPNAPFRAASQSDALTLPAGDAKAKLTAANRKLRFPAGTLTVVGVGPNVTFNRNVEFFVKFFEDTPPASLR